MGCSQPQEAQVPRSTRSEAYTLLDEARALEALADETDVPPDRIEEYWRLSTKLIGLVLDIEHFGQQYPRAKPDDDGTVELRRRLREIAAGLAELSLG